MKRFFIEKIDGNENNIVISGSEANHIIKVMRMQVGDRFTLLDRKGNRFQARITSFENHEVNVNLEEQIPSPPPLPLKIVLCQSLLKSRAMDDVIRKTSELGVSHIIPFISERTVVKLPANKVDGKLTRWREIALNATKQSDRHKPPEIGPVFPIKDLYSAFSADSILKLILWEEEKFCDIKSILQKTLPLDHVIGIIGPEGGFTRSEISMAKAAGFLSVSLGQRILKADTAAITVSAIIQYELGDLALRNKNNEDIP